MNQDLKIFVDQFARFFQPVILASSGPSKAKALLLDLGYSPPEQFKVFENLKTNVDKIQQLIETISQISEEEIESNPGLLISTTKNGVAAISLLINDVQNISSFVQSELNGSQLLAQTDILEKLPGKLYDLLTIEYLKQYHQRIYSFLKLFGIIEINEILEVPNTFYFRHLERIFHWERLVSLLTSPIDLLKTALKDGDKYLYGKTLQAIQEVGLSMSLTPHYKDPNVDVLKFINNNPSIQNWPGFPDLEILRFPLIPGDMDSLGIDIYPLINTTENKITGLVLVLGFDPGKKEFVISDSLKLELEFSGSVANGLGISIDKNDEFKFIDDLFGSPRNMLDDIEFEFKADVTTTANSSEDEDQKLFQIGTKNSTRFELRSFKLQFGIEKKQTTRLYFEASLLRGVIAIKFGDADGFLSKILGDGIESSFDLGIGFSNSQGFYFAGSSSLEIVLPAHVNLGPLQIENLSVSVASKENAIVFSFGSSILVRLGPLTAVIQNVGVSFPNNNDTDTSILQLGFKPPEGVGLSVDAGGISGGGFLKFDDVNKEYTGALELEFKDLFSLKAFGIITTRMPDGSDGFSLLIVITAEFTPVQLGFGFTLNGVGGLLGVNRTTNVDVLKQGIKTNSIESILFPQNVVANISRIISDVKQIFPPQRDHFLICPMGKIGWGTPTLITLELGILIEIPASGFKILGVLKALLPEEDDALLRLQVNFLGEIDFDNKSISFIASLYDSRLLTFTLTGDMAFRILFGDNPLFLLSVGGFHPSFTQVPADLKNMQRLSLCLYDGDGASITLQSYFAVTSNTVQFGAKAELLAGSRSGFNIYGFISYDVLFQFSPFHFVADLSGGVSLRHGTSTVMGIHVSGELSGPSPWDAKGEASVSFFFFSISVPFHVTWGSADNEPPKEKVDIIALLTEQINDNSNWKAAIPSNNKIHVTIKKLPDGMTAVHPFGVLTFSERLVPLKIKIVRFGNELPKDADLFEIKTTDTTLATETVSEEFAPANFFELSDAEKLSRPSFEPMQSGFKITGSSELQIPEDNITRDVEYELSYLGKENKGINRFQYPASIFRAHTKLAATSQSSLSFTNTRISLNAPQDVLVDQEKYVLANVSDMKQYDGAQTKGSYTEAWQQYNELIKTNPQLKDQLQILSTYELNFN